MNMLLRDFPSPATQMPFAVEAEAAGTDLINRMTETTRVRRGN